MAFELSSDGAKDEKEALNRPWGSCFEDLERCIGGVAVSGVEVAYSSQDPALKAASR